MSASIITIFNKFTGNTLNNSEIFELLLDEFYDKFTAVYHIIKDLPKTYIDNIECRMYDGEILGIAIKFENSDERNKTQEDLINNLDHEMFDIDISMTCDDSIIITISDKGVE